MPEVDAIVVGAGPNGLAAAIMLARAGLTVSVYEGQATIGGGARTAELTLPGYLHDVCSAIHPLALASPFFRTLPLDQHGVVWYDPDYELAHPFDDGSAALIAHSFEVTGASLGADADAYRRLMEPFAHRWDELAIDLLGPLPLPPKHPLLMARFGLFALPSAKFLVKTLFKGTKAQAIFTGMAAHSFLRMEQLPSASFGLVLGILAHAVGWPIPKGGSQQIVNAMARYLESLGGQITTGVTVNRIEELPSARLYLFDVTPRQLLKIAGHKFPEQYRRQLEQYRYGPGVFKIDWALNGPIPWKAAECRRAGTVHLGATYAEIALSERLIHEGKLSDRPFTIVAQQSLFDPTRAPEGKHTGWAYCHVPHGFSGDATDLIENQIERFAPGFRDLILERRTIGTAALEAYNPNYIGGDINGGVQDLRQLFTRPVARIVPYSTPAKGVYLCSSSTPPGGGVHGMCGYYAARAALKDLKISAAQLTE
jgi:phytoene dehydrogenase-like protein